MRICTLRKEKQDCPSCSTMRQQKPPLRDFRDLRAWRLGVDIVEQVYHLTKQFPRRDAAGIVTQMQQAAVAIPANIAAGHVHTQPRDYLQYVLLARAALAELITSLEVTDRLKYCPAKETRSLHTQCDLLGEQLIHLQTVLTRKPAGKLKNAKE